MRGFLEYLSGPACLRLGVLIQLTASLTARIQATGAIPGDEFALAGHLYGALVPLRILAALLLVAAAAGVAVEARRRRGRSRWLRISVGAALLGGLIWPVGGLGLALLLWESTWAVETLGGLERTASQLQEGLRSEGHQLLVADWRRCIAWWPGLAALAAVGAYLVAGIESVTYTASFAPELFSSRTLTAYRWRLVDLSAAFGAGMALSYLLPLLLARPVMRLLSRLPGGDLKIHVVVPLALALWATIYCRIGIFRVIGDEIRATGVEGQTEVLLALLFFLWFHLAHGSLFALAERGGASRVYGAGEIWTVAALSLTGFSFAMAPATVVRPRRVTYLVWAALAAGWLAVLVYGAYPDLQDFRDRLIVLDVFTSVNVLVLMMLALAHALRPGRPFLRQSPSRIALGGIVAGLALLSLRPIHGELAVVVHEYTRFGYMIKKGSLREVLRPENRLGYTRPDREFQVHGPGEDRYPAWTPLGGNGTHAKPPILIVLWDAGRPDRMHVYGNPRDTTPVADELAAESIVFERAYSMGTATTCGVRHLFTGRYSTRYMLSTRHAPFFIHALRPWGYRDFFVTAFGSDYNGVSLASFLRGGPPLESDGSHVVNVTHREINREWSDRIKTEKLVATWRAVVADKGPGGLDGTLSYLHLTGTHFPWYNESPVRDYGSSWVDLYDGEMAKVDALTGKAFDVLKQLGVWDRAIVVLTADHGTGLKEHGRFAGFLPYEEQIRVPLLIRVPGVAPRRVKAPVASIDVAPTLVGLFDPGGANPFDGVSLLPLMDGSEPSLKREDLVSLCAFEDAYALIHDGRYKLHYHRTEDYALLFDLKEDPGERVNLIERRPEIVKDLTARLAAFLWRGRTGYANPYHYRAWTPPSED